MKIQLTQTLLVFNHLVMPVRMPDSRDAQLALPGGHFHKMTGGQGTTVRTEIVIRQIQHGGLR